MKTLDEVRAIVRAAVAESNGDRELAIAKVEELARADIDLLVCLAKHGMDIFGESIGQVKH